MPGRARCAHTNTRPWCLPRFVDEEGNLVIGARRVCRELSLRESAVAAAPFATLGLAHGLRTRFPFQARFQRGCLLFAFVVQLEVVAPALRRKFTRSERRLDRAARLVAVSA